MAPARRGIALKDRRLEFAQFVMNLEDMARLLEESFDAAQDPQAPQDGTEAPASATAAP